MNKTPYEAFTNQIPDASHMHLLGSKYAYVKEKRNGI